jgi:hypothetical protein
MRYSTLLLATAGLSGCTLLTDADDTRGGKHTLTVNFHLKGPGGVPASCPAGFQDLLLFASTTGDDGGAGRVQTLVPCAPSGTATMELYTSGGRTYMMEGDPNTYGESFGEDYAFALSLTDPTGEVQRATSFTAQVKLDHDQAIDVDLYPDAGFMLISWELFSGITESRVFSCPAVAVDEVELRYRLFTFEGDPPAPTSTVRWPCDELHPPYYISSYSTGQGFTPALAPEDYVGELIGYRGGVEVARDPSIAFNIRSGNALTETAASLTVPDR